MWVDWLPAAVTTAAARLAPGILSSVSVGPGPATAWWYSIVLVEQWNSLVNHTDRVYDQSFLCLQSNTSHFVKSPTYGTSANLYSVETSLVRERCNVCCSWQCLQVCLYLKLGGLNGYRIYHYEIAIIVVYDFKIINYNNSNITVI